MPIAPLSWKNEFTRSTDPERYREIVRRAQEELRREDKRRKDKERDDEERKSEADGLIEVMVFASATELGSFEVKLNHYEEATYDALIENERLLELMRGVCDDMLEKAYELPDGRRVFESEDGIRVFDEFGTELDPSVITADEIEDWRPKYEAFKETQDSIDALLEERNAIIEYQQKLDEARERVKDGEISPDELKSLERELAADMPESVRAELTSEHAPAPVEAAPDAEPDPVHAANPAVIHDAPVFS